MKRVRLLILFVQISSLVALLDISYAELTPATTLAPTQQAILSLKINNSHSQSILAQMTTPPHLNCAQLFGSLSEIISAEVHSSLQLSCFDSWISILDLNRLGLVSQFDINHLEVLIEVPIELQKTSLIPVQASTLPKHSGPLLHPNVFSQFLNFNLGQDWVWQSPTTIAGRDPLRAELDGAIHFSGNVLEGSGRYSERGTPLWRRGDFRLVHDEVQSSVRYSAGDILYPSGGFQLFKPMGGIAATRQFNLEPYRNTSPLNSYELILKNHSLIKIWMNGNLIQTLDLPAGKYDIRQFPLASGVNEVILEIIDDTGRIEKISTTYLYSDSLLSPETHQFSYSIGFPSQDDEQGRSYVNDNLQFSFSHRKGLNKHLTTGGYVQGDFSGGILGATSVFATPFGNFNTELASSRLYRSHSLGFGGRVSFIHTHFSSAVSHQQNFGLSLEASSPDFTLLGQKSVTSHLPFALSTLYSRELVRSLGFSFNSSYRFGSSLDPTIKPNYTFSFALARHWLNSLDTTLSYTTSLDPTGVSKWNVFFLFAWVLPEKQQTLLANAQTEGNAKQIQWNYHSNNRPVGDTDVHIGSEKNDSFTQANGGIQFSGNRANLGLSHEVRSLTSQTPIEQRSRLRLGTALTFTDGQWAISPPVSDSFVIIKPQKNLENKKILLNSEDRAHVISDLPSYRYYQLHLETENNEQIRLPQEDFLLLPIYKSGFLIPIGNEGKFSIQGTLKTRSGKPIGLIRGFIYPIADLESQNPIEFFTNRGGQFFAEGLSPGRFQLKLDIENLKTAEFEIVSGTKGQGSNHFLDLGEMQLE